MNIFSDFVFISKRFFLLVSVSLIFFCSSANAALCPISPTQYADVNIPDPDPPPNPGEWPEDLSQIMSYINANNITTVRDFLSHMPLNLKKHYSFVKNTQALNVTSLQNPGLLPWGSGSRFMMNIGTTPGTPLYEVVDIAFLQPDGDWEFRSLDFGASPPQLSPHGGNGGECRECHGLGGLGGTGPLRPFLGNYLFWFGFFSDSNGAEGEAVTAEEKPILDAIKNGQHNMDRWHAPLYGSYLYAEVGVSNMLPDHAYGPGLTIFNTEMAASVTESLHKRMSRSPDYRGLREEMLLLSYCDGKQLSASDKSAAFTVVQNAGGSPQNFISYNSWAGVYQALDLDPMHELPLHIRAVDRATTTEADMNWNTGVSPLREGVDLLILMELAQENSQVANMLSSNPSSYSMTGGCSFPTLKDHLDHKIYALYTLRGNARQLARESYYDIDYMRIHSSWSYITGSLCSLLSANIGPGTIGNPTTPGNLISTANSSQVGEYLTGGPASSGDGMSLYVFDNDLGTGGSSCYGSCATAWPPLTVGSPSDITAPGGLGTFSTTTRTDGALQVTYNGRPIYFYANDNQPGDTVGHGVGGTWWLAATNSGGSSSGGSSSSSGGSSSSSGGSSSGGGLTNGQPISGLSATTGSELNYYINVPSGASNLVISISGGSGDADLYTQLGSVPTDNSYACRPYIGGNNETCTEPNPSPGQWHIRLKAYSSFSGVTLVASYDGGAQNIPPTPNANGPYSGAVGLPINFSSAGSIDPDGSIVSYSWSFGNGSSSSQANPSYAYPAPGNYIATLTVTDDQGASSSVSAQVLVSGGSSSGGSSSGGSSSGGSSSGGSSSGGSSSSSGGSSSGGCNQITGNANGPYTGTVGVPLNFSSAGSCSPNGGIVEQEWDFGNGGSSTQANPSHTYNTTGTYEVVLLVIDDIGNEAEVITTATITSGGGSSSSGGSSSGGSSSGGSSSGGSSSGGSSSGGSSSGGSSSGGSSSGGSSSSSGGSSSGGCSQITGNANGPYTGNVGTPVNFSSAGSCSPNGGIVEQEWDFGDGGSSTQTNPSHTYNSAGTYEVVLLVIDDIGNEAEVITTATITTGGGSSSSSSGGSSSGGSSSSSGGSSSGGNQPPIAIANGPYDGTVGSNIGFSRAGSYDPDGTITAYLWNFGDGSTTTTQNPVHAYSAAGTYNVTLTVTDNGGLSASSSTTATVTEAVTTLGNGVPITNLSGAANSEQTFYIHIHGASPSNLNINISGGSGDVDLYVRQGSMPTSSVYDCRPYLGGNNETCTFPTPVHGPYFIMLRGYSAYSGVTLSGTYNEGGGSSSSGGSSSGGSSSSSGGGSSGGNEYGLQNACSLGRPAMSNTNITLGEAICTQSSSGQTNFRYTPTASDVGKNILFTIGHGSGVAGLTANQDFNAYASEADYLANPSIIEGSFGLDPLNANRTYNRVIMSNVQAGKDIWISLNASGSFSGVALKGEVIVPPDPSMPDACAAGSPPITDQYVTLGQAVCGQSSQGPGFYTHFIYRPTAAEAGRSFVLEMAHGTGDASMTVNQHYSSAPTSGGTAFAHEEHLADRPDLVFSSARPGVEQRVVYPNATANTDIFVVIPPGSNGFSNFTFRISLLPAGSQGNQAPTANANGGYAGPAGSTINFSSAGSDDPDGTITGYQWDFGDGLSSNQANPGHAYSSEGTYTAALTVTDDDGDSDTSTATVSVEAPASSGGIEDACATESSQNKVALYDGNPVCVKSNSSSWRNRRFYFSIPSSASSFTITTAHGTGNGDLYYRKSNYPSTSNYEAKSTAGDNAESISINDSGGTGYVRIYGVHSGMSIQVDFN